MVGLFVKPLFEAMVEQNKSLQSGAAISMGKMVNSATGPPVVAFQKLCPRICKLLNSPNYITKASLLPVVGSLSQRNENKLQNLAGQRSDVLENLSPIVRARVDALKDIQMRGTICPTQNWDVIKVMEHMGSWTTSSVHQRFDQ
ncbi:hypothetical protein Bca101_048040 [Brassica carinata]